MLDIIERSPSVGSLRCDPMTTDEIDAHPDRDRIWATISAMSGHIESERHEGYEEGAAEVKDAVEEETDRCEEELDRWIEKLADDAEGMTKEWLVDQLITASAKEILS
ncbi:hypothetical protein [Roseovarius indicus]|uniref:Uncharacterized protein n=1 Tax=Roseovarius indicus TaxID=540747 RepID=A0A0T5P8T3_9RHOB|nr:hypothetical protein [Roseovarius indicus]KRS17514.1 hypothetical protein XM52_13610 [Roseovarius indicus]QEW26717.1 hypothetical protein RIdsm_02519 [Roseovarius indicus]SFD61165.1 hypothetical protein SAMN04488031_101823 [Roseovarius indicus]